MQLMKSLKTSFLFILTLFLGFVQAYGQCGYSIKANKTVICEKEVVDFSIVNAPSGIKELEWDFGLKKVKNDNSPLVLFNSPGTYTVQLVITLNTSKVCTVKVDDMITVNALPDMGQIVANIKEVCEPGKNIQLSNTSKRAVKWNWTVESDYYSGNKSTITHKTENRGWPYVQLTVESKEGCTNSQIFDSVFQVLYRPKVNLSKTNTLICELPGTLRVNPTFDYKGSKIKSYVWDFEGATINADANEKPSEKYYNTPGVYDISLKMRSSKGCKFDYFFKDTVRVVDVNSANIKASAMGGKGCLSMRHKVIVKRLDTSLYSWEFDENAVSWVDSTNMDSTVFLFKKEGKHTINLRLKKGPCNIKFPIKIEAGNSDLLADFSIPKCLCNPNDSLIAKNLSEPKSGLSYQWTIMGKRGFLITSNSKDLGEVVGRYGKFAVTLLATDNKGCSDIEHEIINIKRNIPNEEDIQEVACLKENFQLKRDSLCNVDSNGVIWRFFDENDKKVLTEVGIGIEAQFPSEGFYSVSVTIKSKTGCFDSIFLRNHIWVRDCLPDSDTIKASFVPENGCTGKVEIEVLEALQYLNVSALFIHRSDKTVQVAGSYKYPFITFKPTKAGVYDLKVRVSSKNGLQYKDYYIDSIAIINDLKVTGEIGRTWGCFPNKITELRVVKVENSLYYGKSDTSVTFKWKIFPFDKGKIANDRARFTTVTTFEAGQVDVQLTAISASNCIAQWQAVNKVNEQLKAEFFLPADACYGDTIIMNNQSSGPIIKYEWRSSNSRDGFAPNQLAKEPQLFADGKGKRKIVLTVTDTSGCTASIEKEIHLVDIELDFTVLDTTPKCSPATYFFRPKGLNVEKYEWDFGDGDYLKTNKKNQIAKIYDLRRVDPYRNTFTVSLEGKHSSGCVQKVTKHNIITIRGPWPKFEMSNLTGCSPHVVEIKDISKNVSKLYFDYGDKTGVDSIVKSQHIYVGDTTKEVSYFRPYVVAHDDFGCRVGYFLNDTVKVYSLPQARFVGNPKNGCEPHTVALRSRSKFAHELGWYIPQANISDEGKRTVNILNAGLYDVQLLVKNKIGCTDELYKPKYIEVYEKPQASFTVNDTVGCLGRGLDFNNTSFSKAKISSNEWNIKVGSQKDTAYTKNHSMKFTDYGKLDAKLIIIDENGCTDTSNVLGAANIYKELPVETPSFNFISHLNNSEMALDWKPVNMAYTRKIGINANVGNNYKWIEIPELQTTAITYKHDSLVNQSNCFQIELTDKCRDVHPSEEHCSVHLDVNRENKKATELSWNHYKGWEYVSFYTVYRASTESDYRLLASLPGWQTTYTDSNFCDSIYTYKVMAQNSTGPEKSFSNSLKHKTKYTYQDAPLEILVSTVENNNEIVTYWRKSKQLGDLTYHISKTEQLSGKNVVWQSTADTIIQDFKADINKFHYTYHVRVEDKCGNISVESNMGRSILLNVVQNGEDVDLIWNKYKHWDNGVKEYIVEVKPPNAKWFTQLGVVTDTTISDDYAFLNYEEPYRYRVKAVENGANPDTSYSNERVVIPVPSVFAANAFSPNGDGVNDEFNIMGWALLEDFEDIEEFSLKIYNRWGERVFESHDISQGWDGTFNGTDCQLDQYIWHAKVTALNGKIYFLRGGVLLMR
jgi:gliding motility-associated-like protein